MRTLNLRPADAGSVLARFDVEVTPEIKLASQQLIHLVRHEAGHAVASITEVPMRILNLRRTSGAGSLVALFDLAATPEITLHDWQLRQTPKGMRAFPPSPRGGRSTARVEPNTFTMIGRLAAAAFSEGDVPNDRSTTAV